MPVHFGAFVLDPETRELLRGGQRVALSPQAFDLLCILVAERPKAISKSDLQERLWPATFVVEKNLANRVSEIRGGARRRTVRAAIHPDGPTLWLRVREPAARAGTGPPGSHREVSYSVKWQSGRGARPG